MRKSPAAAIVAACLATAGGAVWWAMRLPRGHDAFRPESAVKETNRGAQPVAHHRTETKFPSTDRARRETSLSPAEKAQRIARIQRDYDDLRSRAAAALADAGDSFPGGLNAFLRELAWIEREQHADLAQILTPDELESLELRETSTGQAVSELLAGTPATAEQQRAVFRLQRDFDERYAPIAELSAAETLQREIARCELQDKVRDVLGRGLFAAWLRGEGDDFARLAAVVARQQLPATVALDVWDEKSRFTLRRLEIIAEPNVTRNQARVANAELVRETAARVSALIGERSLPAIRNEALSWLPQE